MDSVQQAFDKSLAPDIIEKLLRVLDQTGQKMHAEQIEDVYKKNIAACKPCKRCKKGRIKVWSESLRLYMYVILY